MRCVALVLLAGVAHAAEWDYRVSGHEQLTVEATIAAGFADEFSVDDRAEPFVKDVEVKTPGGWQKVPPKGTSWFPPGCPKGCSLRYRVELARAAKTLGNETAQQIGEVIQAPPSTWLLHPLHPGAGARYHFDVTTPPGITFVTGVRPAKTGYQADASMLAQAPYSAFGRIAKMET